MRAQHSGTVINISSVGGEFTTILGGWYHASKYAVEALSDALRMETAPHGIHVVVVQPGSIRTEWGADRRGEAEGDLHSTGAYATMADGTAKALAASSAPNARTTSELAVIGKTIVKIAKARRPHTRYRIGFGARPLIFLSRLLSDRAFDSLMRRAIGV